MADTTARKATRRSWYIEVCKTCDRLARWPFCEHKADDGEWYELVRVTETGRVRRG